MESPLTIQHLPRAIVHIDGDAFFAACEQSRNPVLKGKPVVTGKERGIAASMSYEAKACGVTRGMRISEIKRRCPQVVLLPSDYETYSLLSKRLFAIVRRYTPDVEEYSIDECFADLTGLQRALKGSYSQIAARIKQALDVELGVYLFRGPGADESRGEDRLQMEETLGAHLHSRMGYSSVSGSPARCQRLGHRGENHGVPGQTRDLHRVGVCHAAGTLGSSASAQTLLRDLAGVTGHECVGLGDTREGGLSVRPEIQDFLAALRTIASSCFPSWRKTLKTGA